MSILEVLQNQGTEEESGIKGVAVAVVTNNRDPRKEGRVKITYPWRNSDDESFWARIATVMAGNAIGSYFLPQVGDEVLVAFENGNIDYPYIIGSLWSSQIPPPEGNDDGENNIRKIKSRNGHEFILDDTNQNEKLEIRSKSGHKILFSDAPGGEKIEIVDKTGNNSIAFDANQNSIEIKSNLKLSIESKMIEIKAGGTMSLEATGNLTIKGAMVMIN
jgi:uncharacterized protein involved in type VI secretion and phage assembly